jgi:hypothetical protein
LPGVPDKTPVDELNDTPWGRFPDSEYVGVGDPVAVTWKLNEWPTTTDVDEALVMVGFTPTLKLTVFEVEPEISEVPAYVALTL